jgi:TolA-binding protein
MKNLKSVICVALLVTALSATTSATAKTGQISTTKTGQISTTKTGQISTTKTGQISTTKTGQISTTRAGMISMNGFQILDLLVTFIIVW